MVSAVLAVGVLPELMLTALALLHNGPWLDAQSADRDGVVRSCFLWAGRCVPVEALLGALLVAAVARSVVGHGPHGRGLACVAAFAFAGGGLLCAPFWYLFSAQWSLPTPATERLQLFFVDSCMVLFSLFAVGGGAMLLRARAKRLCMSGADVLGVVAGSAALGIVPACVPALAWLGMLVFLHQAIGVAHRGPGLEVQSVGQWWVLGASTAAVVAARRSLAPGQFGGPQAVRGR